MIKVHIAGKFTVGTSRAIHALPGGRMPTLDSSNHD